MPTELSHNLVTLVVVVVAAAIGWTILRSVLRLTMRVFAIGCFGLLILGAIVWAVASLSGR